MQGPDGRFWTALAIGAVAALAVSRLMPPVAAHTVGRMRMTDAIERLSRDHDAFLDFLDRMEAAEGRAQRMQLLMRLKRRLTAHAMAEEDVIYPILRERLGEREDTRGLYAEHGDIKVFLYRLEDKVADDEAWRATVREMREVLARHARQEEEEEFPRLRRILEEREMAQMNGLAARERALVL
jgi:hemerythrin superfamily protein